MLLVSKYICLCWVCLYELKFDGVISLRIVQFESDQFFSDIEVWKVFTTITPSIPEKVDVMDSLVDFVKLDVLRPQLLARMILPRAFASVRLARMKLLSAALVFACSLLSRWPLHARSSLSLAFNARMPPTHKKREKKSGYQGLNLRPRVCLVGWLSPNQASVSHLHAVWFSV